MHFSVMLIKVNKDYLVRVDCEAHSSLFITGKTAANAAFAYERKTHVKKRNLRGQGY